MICCCYKRPWHNRNQDVSSHDIQYLPPDIQKSNVHLCMPKCLALKAATRPLQLLTAKETLYLRPISQLQNEWGAESCSPYWEHTSGSREIQRGWKSEAILCQPVSLLYREAVIPSTCLPKVFISFPVLKNVCLPPLLQHVWLHSNRFTIRVNAN